MSMTKGADGSVGRGEITLTHIETFEAGLAVWSVGNFLEQWRSAIRRTVKDRDVTCMIRDLCRFDGPDIFKLHFYTLIPSEETYAPFDQSREGDGIFVTERFLWVTRDVHLLKDPFVIGLDDGDHFTAAL